MKKNKKLLISFLALNAILISYAKAETVQATRYERMYNSIVKNIEKGNTNKKTYQIIEQILIIHSCVWDASAASLVCCNRNF